MKKIILAPAIVLAAIGLSGCATVINGTSQDLDFDSSPKGAKVTLSNGAGCVAPCSLSLKRRHDLRADFALEGYKPVYVLVQSRTGGAAAGNILLGGLIGGVVDGANGASNHLAPNPVSVTLVPLGAEGKEMLLDKKGKETVSVQENNDKVRIDVAKTIGSEAAGLPPQTPAAADPALSPSPSPTGG